MPRYFLHLRDGTDEILDPDGSVFDDGAKLRSAVPDKAGCIREMLLGHRQIITLRVAEPGNFEPARKFAKDMGDPGPGIALADVEHPFPEDRRVDQSVDPHRVGDVRMILDQGPDRLSG